MNIIEQLDKEQIARLSEGREIPHYQPGDTVQFRFDIGRRCDIAMIEMPKVQLHTGIEAPFQRYLVDRDCRLAAVPTPAATQPVS